MNTATESYSVPRGWVALAAAVLVAAAAAGVYLGVVRSLGAHDLPSDSDTLSAVPNVTNAKPLASDPIADDAHIRALAREEALAALRSAAPKPKPVTPKEDEIGADSGASSGASSGSEATAALNAAASGRTTAPRLVTPRSSAGTPSDITVVRPSVPTVRPSARPPATSNPYPPTLY